MSDSRYSAPACCAHNRVVRVTPTSTIGLSSEWWQCGDCPMTFAPSPAAPSEPVLWAVYDAHGRMMTYTESPVRADADRVRYEGYGDATWVANRPFSVVPLYTRPAPREEVTEAMVEAGCRGWFNGEPGVSCSSNPREVVRAILTAALHAERAP